MGKKTNLIQVFGIILVALGIIVAAGSAGDCDGKCMEYANDLGTMVFLAISGLVSMALGAILIIQGERFN